MRVGYAGDWVKLGFIDNALDQLHLAKVDAKPLHDQAMLNRIDKMIDVLKTQK